MFPYIGEVHAAIPLKNVRTVECDMYSNSMKRNLISASSLLCKHDGHQGPQHLFYVLILMQRRDLCTEYI